MTGPAMTTTAQAVLERAEQCALYNFDSVEMVECKHALWEEIVAALRMPGPAVAAREPDAWLVLSEETGNTRIWWRDRERAEAWAAQHEKTLIPLYRALPSEAIGREAREKEITRLATIEECAREAEKSGCGDPTCSDCFGNQIAAAIRALAVSRPHRGGGQS
jgi:hypothetical protein